MPKLGVVNNNSTQYRREGSHPILKATAQRRQRYGNNKSKLDNLESYIINQHKEAQTVSRSQNTLDEYHLPESLMDVIKYDADCGRSPANIYFIALDHGYRLLTGQQHDGSIDLRRIPEQERARLKYTPIVQAGDFYEIYGAEFADGTRIGAAWDVSAEFSWRYSDKQKYTYHGDECTIIMTGFPLRTAAENTARLLDFGWTVFTINQEKAEDGRNVIGRMAYRILSPAINGSAKTECYSTVLMHVYIQVLPKHVNMVTAGRTYPINMGLYYIDSVSGDNGVLSLYNKDYKDAAPQYSELVKFISIKSPRELVVHLDYPPEIMPSDDEVYSILGLYDFNVQIRRHNRTDLTNIKMPGYQCILFNTVFGNESTRLLKGAHVAISAQQNQVKNNKSKQGITRNTVLQYLGLEDQIYDTHRIVIALALEYVFNRDPSILQLLEKPEIHEGGNEYLMLANNCLQQLDILSTIDNNGSSINAASSNAIVNGNTYTSEDAMLTIRERQNFKKQQIEAAMTRNILGTTIRSPFSQRRFSLIDLLDFTRTAIGKRHFRKRLSIPITDPVKLIKRYDQIEFWQKTQQHARLASSKANPIDPPLIHLREMLSKIRDIPRYMRQMATGHLGTDSLSVLINSLKTTVDLHKYVSSIIQQHNIQQNNTNPLTVKLLELSKSELAALPSETAVNNLKAILKELDETFDFQPYILNGDIRIPAISSIEHNIFKYGYDPDLDKTYSHVERCRQIISKVGEKLQKNIDERNVKINHLENGIIKGKKPVGTPTVSEECNAKHNKHLTINSKAYWILTDSTVCNAIGSLVSQKAGVNIPKLDIDIMLPGGKKYSESIPYSAITFTSIKKAGRYLVNNGLLQTVGTEYISYIEDLRTKMRQAMRVWRQDFFDNHHETIQEFVQFIADIDVTQSCVCAADKYGYCRPQIMKHNEDQESYLIARQLRHPIIERIREDIEYVANDAIFGATVDGEDPETQQNGMLLFGVNASGKSSYSKAVGIAVIMAQAGMFVPATSMEFWPFQYIFTRIRNNDDIHRSLSSFAVEVKELNIILQHANSRGLVLGDELCCGTENNGATALVAAVLEELERRGTKYVFATHFHRLVEMECIRSLKHMRMWHLDVRKDMEREGKLIYNRVLMPGSGPSDYTTLVCDAMGMLNNVVSRARELREELVSGTAAEHGGLLFSEEDQQVRIHNKVLMQAKKGVTTSKYNKNLELVGKCMVCGWEGKCDTHHIRQQQMADDRGIIVTSNTEPTTAPVIHKNMRHNLVELCKQCHMAVDGQPQRLVIRGYRDTSDGGELDYYWLEPNGTPVDEPPDYKFSVQLNSQVMNNEVMTTQPIDEDIQVSDSSDDEESGSEGVSRYIKELSSAGKTIGQIQGMLRRRGTRRTQKEIRSILV